jgi:Coenzyme PQQ synthesis protein D (PqqD)
VTDNSVLFPATGVQAQPFEDGAVLLDTRSGAVYQLNRVGVDIWSQLCSGATMATIHEVITERYSIPQDQAERDVRNLIAALAKAGLVSPEKPAGSQR